MHLNIYTEGSFTTMEKKIRIGICGYGNLGHGVELAVNRAEDMELVGVFSRRDLPGTASGVPAINLKHVLEYKDKIDVMTCAAVPPQT